MPKLRMHRGTYFVSLPKEYVEGLGWEKGDTVVVAPQEGRIIIESMVQNVVVVEKEGEEDDAK